MPVECLVRIKNGSRIIQDRRFGKWPACVPPKEETEDHETKYPEAVFIARKSLQKGNKKVWWDCRRNGYGILDKPGVYGNGSILAEDVEILSPMHFLGVLKLPEEGK